MRVCTASRASETNTVAPMPTGLASFIDDGAYFPGGSHPPEMGFLAGPLHTARQRARTDGCTLIDDRVAAAQPGGTITGVAYETLRDQILADMRAALPVQLVQLVHAGSGVQVVLISRRSQAMGTDLFTQLGCDLAAQRIVVVKSSQHFRTAFAPVAVRCCIAQRRAR